MNNRTMFRFFATAVLTCLAASTLAQTVTFADAGLDAAVRDALHKPTGLLTTQDLLTLTNLNASDRSIFDLQGLEAARNLVALDLSRNFLATPTIPSTLTKLSTADLSFQFIGMRSCSFPDTLTNLSRVLVQINALTNITLPNGLVSLLELNLRNNQFTNLSLPPSLRTVGALNVSMNKLTGTGFLTNLTQVDNLDLELNRLPNFVLPSRLTNIFFLNLQNNSLTNVSLPNGLSRLDTLRLDATGLGKLALPTGLTRLVELSAAAVGLSNLVLPADMTNLTTLELSFNLLTNVTFPQQLRSLVTLDLDNNEMRSFALPSNLTRLASLNLSQNLLTNLVVPAGLTNLTSFDASFNQLRTLSLPAPVPSLTSVNLGVNQLISLQLPPGMTNLQQLFLEGNVLTNLSLPPNLSALVTLQLANNRITTLSLPPDMTSLTTLVINGNPLTTLTLSQQLASTNLAALVASLRNQGVTVIILQAGANNPPVLAAIPNQTIVVGTSLVITNVANDPDSPPQVVTFSLGAGTPTNATINPANGVFSWRTPTAAQVGTNTFTVIVTDNGQPPLSASRSFSVVVLPTNSPPTVAITSPTNGASFIAPATITVQAAASDSDGSVTNVQFFDGTNSLGNVSASPFNLSVTLGVGPHALTAVASDNRGARTTTLPVSVTVTTNTPPTVAIISPTNGASFIAPATITVQAAASDSDGSVTNVQFFDGTNSLGNVSASPYNLAVTLGVGRHTLTAVASDNRGARRTTLAVTVTGLAPIVISGTTHLPDGTFQFAFTNTPGASFSILASTNLALPVDQWARAGAALETSPGKYQFIDQTSSIPKRFYRVRSP